MSVRTKGGFNSSLECRIITVMDIVLYYCGNRKTEENDFMVSRPEGNPRYLFIHFVSSLEGINTIDGYLPTNPGACIVYTPGFPQKFASGDIRFANDYIDFVQNDNSFFSSIKLPLNTVFYPGMSKEISQTLSEIVSLQQSGDSGAGFRISNAIETLFIGMSQKIHHHSVGPKKEYGEKVHVSFEDVRLDVYEHPENKNVALLADRMGFSRAYFTKTWRNFFKASPGEDIRKAKYAKAVTLLGKGEKGTAVGSFLGFKTSEYFYRFMKKMTSEKD